MQRNWIGRSEGAEVDFPRSTCANGSRDRSASSRPAPTRSSARPTWCWRPSIRWSTGSRREAQRRASKTYRQAAARKSDLDRTDLAKTKTGVFTGAYAINPVNGESIPIWIADYVLMGYGTGAIMAVPGPRRARLRVCPDVRPADRPRGRAEHWNRRMLRSTHAEAEPGVAVNSRNDEITLDGLPTAEAKAAITDWLEKRGLGKKTVNYKLRDWLFSRQRYWGEPFPIVLDEDDRTHAVAESELPVRLPELEDFKPTGKPEPPLEQGDGLGPLLREIPARDQHDAAVGRLVLVLPALHRSRTTTSCPGTRKKSGTGCRSTSTSAAPSTPCLHLLYSRFWHKVLFDRGLVSTPEPFQKLVNQGMILGETEYTGYRDAEGRWVRPGRERTRRTSIAVKLERGPGRQEGRGIRAGGRPERPGRCAGPQDVEEPRQCDQPRRDRRGIRRRQLAALRNVHGTARGGQALEHEGRRGRLPLPGPGLADDRRRRGRRRAARPAGQAGRADARAGQGRRADDRGGHRRPRSAAVQHGDQPA